MKESSEKIKKYTSMRMALRGNLLTSDICGNHCVFCSNKLNPESVHTVRVGNRKIDDLIEEVDFIPEGMHQIHLGETNFNTTEGELIEYPHWRELILAIKRKRPDIKITITSSGNSLTEDVVVFLKENDIDIFISIHSMVPETRARITGNTLKRAMTAINSIDLCNKHGVNIQVVRLVPMPFVTNDDIEYTLRTLLEKGIKYIDIWVASFSKFAEDKTIDDIKDKSVEQIRSECNRISKVINLLKEETAKNFASINLYPFPNYASSPIVVTVKEDSYAYNVGFRNEDLIVSINNKNIINGSDVSRVLQEYEVCDVIVNRNGCFKTIKCNGRLANDNIIANYIINIDDILNIYENVIVDRTHTLVVSAEANYETLMDSLSKLGLSKDDFYHTCAKNVTFGGSICVSGLLTVDDYLIAIDNFRKNNPEANITKIIAPHHSFMATEKDLTNRPLQDLKFEACVDVILI